MGLEGVVLRELVPGDSFFLSHRKHGGHGRASGAGCGNLFLCSSDHRITAAIAHHQRGRGT